MSKQSSARRNFTPIADKRGFQPRGRIGDIAMTTVERLGKIDGMLEKVVEHVVAARARLAVLRYAQERGLGADTIDELIKGVDSAAYNAEKALTDAYMELCDTFGL